MIMNKSVLLTGILVFFTIVLAATKTDLQEANLFGKVKSIQTNRENTVYNQQGYLESITYYSGGVEAYQYDSNNRLLTIVYTNSDNKETSRSTKTYDTAGLMIKEVRKDWVEEIDNLEYNAKQQLVRIKTYYADGRLKGVSEYAYDTAGNKISEEEYNNEMELNYKTLYTYDKHNKLVEEQRFIVRDTDIPNKSYTYDEDGFVTADTYFYNGEVEIRHEYSRDKYHNIITDEAFEMGDFISYDYIYTYDKQGNWLTREEYRDVKLQDTQKRSITYY